MKPASNRSNSFSNGITSREGITGPLAQDVPEVFKGLHDPRMGQ